MSLLSPICLTQRPDTEAADLSVSFTTTLFLYFIGTHTSESSEKQMRVFFVFSTLYVYF